MFPFALTTILKNSQYVAFSLRFEFIFTIFLTHYTTKPVYIYHFLDSTMDFNSTLKEHQTNILRGIFTDSSVINYSTIFDATTPIHSRGAFIFLPISSEKDPRVIKVVIIFSRNRIRKIFTKNHSEFSIRSYPHLCK